MIPYSYNMVDMGGIDLAVANGLEVPGLYASITEAVTSCGDVVLYNWKFAGIEIAPQYSQILLGEPITINGSIQVTEQDIVTVPGINREPTLEPLIATENGIYTPGENVDGFSRVLVSVPQPVPVTPSEVAIQWESGMAFQGGSFEFAGYLFVSGRLDITSGSGWRTFGVIPEGYRPPSGVGFMAGHGGNVAVRDGIIAAENGELRIYTNSSDSYLYFTFFYKFEEE